MQYFSWETEKNRKLKRERNISFDEIVLSIEEGQLLDILEHPDQKKYPGQKIYVVARNEYAYLVPFEEKENELRLITIIPSRKATKEYLRKKL
jgi:uncharacterized DUF497 family protein